MDSIKDRSGLVKPSSNPDHPDNTRPIRVMIPAGASAGTGVGGVGGASVTTTKTGDPLSSPSVCVVDVVPVCIDYDIVSARHEPGVPDEHRTHIAIHDGCGLDCVCDVLWDRIAIVPGQIYDYVDVHVRAYGEA